MQLGVFRWIVLGFAVIIFVIAILAPYATLIAVSFSKSWGLEFWKNLTLANYKFILFEYNVTSAHPQQRAAGDRGGDGRVLLGTVMAGSTCAPHPGRKILD